MVHLLTPPNQFVQNLDEEAQKNILIDEKIVKIAELYSEIGNLEIEIKEMLG